MYEEICRYGYLIGHSNHGGILSIGFSCRVMTSVAATRCDQPENCLAGSQFEDGRLAFAVPMNERKNEWTDELICLTPSNSCTSFVGIGYFLSGFAFMTPSFSNCRHPEHFVCFHILSHTKSIIHFPLLYLHSKRFHILNFFVMIQR